MHVFPVHDVHVGVQARRVFYAALRCTTGPDGHADQSQGGQQYQGSYLPVFSNIQWIFIWPILYICSKYYEKMIMNESQRKWYGSIRFTDHSNAVLLFLFVLVSICKFVTIFSQLDCFRVGL